MLKTLFVSINPVENPVENVENPHCCVMPLFWWMLKTKRNKHTLSIVLFCHFSICKIVIFSDLLILNYIVFMSKKAFAL